MPPVAEPDTDLAERSERPPKPRLRGWSHLVAFFAALVCGPLLVVGSSTTSGRVSTAIYAVSLVALFGFSALLHRGRWSPRVEPWMRRLDHSTIFVFIAGTYTPVVVLSLDDTAKPVLIAAWLGAAAGVVITLAWIDAPRWITAGSYLGVGWIALAVLPQLFDSLGVVRFLLLAGGGAIFTLGAVVYARKRPDPAPLVFGYHEVFHALVIVAVGMHYALITSLPR